MRTTDPINPEVRPTILGYLYTNGDTQNPIVMNDSDFNANTLSFKFGTSQSGEFTVGGAIISEVDFTLWNDTGKFDNVNWYDARLSIDLYCDDGNSGQTIVRMGYFFVGEHHERGRTISVVCYDALKFFDEHQLHELRINGEPITDAQWETGIYISDLIGYIKTAAEQSGLTIVGLSSAASSIKVHNPNNPQMTLRAALSYLTQMVGQYVKIDYGGTQLKFDWYDLSTVHDAGTTFSHDLQTADITIQGVSVSDANDENVTTLPASGFNAATALVIDGNPFIDADNISAVATEIYNALGGVNGLTFRPGSAAILANPAYDAGDVLQVATGQEQGIIMIATNLTYKLQVRENVSSDATVDSSDLRVNQKQYIREQANQAIDEAINNGTIPSGDTMILNVSSIGNVLGQKAIARIGSGVTAPMIKINRTDGSIATESLTQPIYFVFQSQRLLVPTPTAAPNHGWASDWFLITARISAYQTYGNSATVVADFPITFSCFWSNLSNQNRLVMQPMGRGSAGAQMWLMPITQKDGYYRMMPVCISEVLLVNTPGSETWNVTVS